MPFIPSKIWKDARELLDPAVGSVVDEFVNENYNSAVAMSDFYLGDPSTSATMRSQTRNAILLVKAISLGCLGYAAEAVEAANAILATLHSSATVRTWHYAAPQLRNIIPVDVIVAFNRLVAPLVMQKTRKPAAPPEEPVDPLTAAVVAAHPWKFWGECPGGILPWRPVVLSPTQFHRSPRARKQIDAVLSPAVETASEYVTALRALEDPEHVNFSPSKRCTLKLDVQSDLLREGDAGMHELFASFEAMNFSPIKATRRR